MIHIITCDLYKMISYKIYFTKLDIFLKLDLNYNLKEILKLNKLGFGSAKLLKFGYSLFINRCGEILVNM